MRKNRRIPIMFPGMAVLLLCTALLVAVLKEPADHKDRIISIEVPKGSNFAMITDILEEAGLIKYRLAFTFLARAKGVANHIRAGEYDLNSSMSPSLILDKLVRGEIKGYRITVPEGYSLSQITDTLMEKKLIKRDRFLKLASDREFLSSLRISAKTVEGFLFPETYIFTKSMGEKEIITMMVNQFWRKITPAMVRRAQELGYSTEEIITLASLIEKESRIAEEKPLISAVFHNRLKKKMRLQCDPTAVYNLKDFGGAVTRTHLRTRTPYNTYIIRGLPPGPIASPGVDSIAAALYPAPVDHLYFVSRNDGSHQFSVNLASHNRAVQEFRAKKQKD